jgi:methylated-DNA-protein-cysteine methyltransferase related protein
MVKRKKKTKKGAKSRTRVGAADSVPGRVLAAVRRIPRGKVCTYGNVAEVAGLPRRARLVGTVLRQTPALPGLPWYRVINAGGRISFPVGSDAYARQRRKLEAEGVVFVGGRVDLRRYGWPAHAEQLDELLWKPR